MSVFIFLDSEKESARQAQWFVKVPQENWKPGKDEVPGICELHFQEKHVIQESSDTNLQQKRRKVGDDMWVGGTLKRKGLQKYDFPSIWTEAPDHLSTITPACTTSCSSSQARQQNVERMEEFKKREGIKRDKYGSLEEWYNTDGCN